MNEQITFKDWEALSAYIDEQLSVRENTRLEKRLETDNVLKAALLEIQKIKAILQSQPIIKAPRNFTLTPEMVGQKTASPFKVNLFSSLRIASILATILFLVVFLGDLAFQIYQPMPMMVAQAPAKEAEFLLPETREGLGGGGGEEEAIELLEAPEAEQPAAAEFEQEAELATQTDISSMAESEVEEQDQKGEVKKPRASATILPTEVADLVSEYPLIEGQNDLEIPPKDYLDTSDYSYPMREARWSVLDWIKLILATFALGTGIVYFLLKRRKFL